uniref:Uncharacterized protein n=1 Tax=Cacopsylla melanoneura TaxID=428564 RepID=A0A8D8YLR3_9HEMI
MLYQTGLPPHRSGVWSRIPACPRSSSKLTLGSQLTGDDDVGVIRPLNNPSFNRGSLVIGWLAVLVVSCLNIGVKNVVKFVCLMNEDYGLICFCLLKILLLEHCV